MTSQDPQKDRNTHSAYFRMLPLTGADYRREQLEAVVAAINNRVVTIADPGLAPSGFTYLGQFIDHELTHMRHLDQLPGPSALATETLQQRRSCAFDLDSIYGAGLADDVVAYTEAGWFYSEFSRDGLIYDLPRGAGAEGYEARIAEHHNDENFIVAQLQVLFMNAHNRLMQHYRSSFDSVEACFRHARAELALTLQALVVLDFLPQFLDQAVYAGFFAVRQEAGERPPLLLDGVGHNSVGHNGSGKERSGKEDSGKDNSGNAGVAKEDLGKEHTGKECTDKEHSGKERSGKQGPGIPLEFAGAAYRFGHSLVRGSYPLNDDYQLPVSLKALFGLTGRGRLRGLEDGGEGCDLAPYAIDWKYFFNLDGKSYSNVFTIKTRLADPLRALLNERPGNQDLMLRNLLRGQELGLPDGQSACRWLRTARPEYCQWLGLQELSPEQIRSHDLGAVLQEQDLAARIPLWLYILMEPAYNDSRHTRLGKLGSIILAETFRMLLGISGFPLHELEGGTLVSTVRTRGHDICGAWLERMQEAPGRTLIEQFIFFTRTGKQL